MVGTSVGPGVLVKCWSWSRLWRRSSWRQCCRHREGPEVGSAIGWGEGPGVGDGGGG